MNQQFSRRRVARLVAYSITEIYPPDPTSNIRADFPNRPLTSGITNEELASLALRSFICDYCLSEIRKEKPEKELFVCRSTTASAIRQKSVSIGMTRRNEMQTSAKRSQQTAGNVLITFPDLHNRTVPAAQRFTRVSVQRVSNTSRAPTQFFDQYLTVQRDKAAQTGRWILDTMAVQNSSRQVDAESSPPVSEGKVNGRLLDLLYSLEETAVATEKVQ